MSDFLEVTSGDHTYTFLSKPVLRIMPPKSYISLLQITIKVRIIAEHSDTFDVISKHRYLFLLNQGVNPYGRV